MDGDEGYEDGEGEHHDDDEVFEEEDEELEDEMDEHTQEPISARPRRMSEISIKKTKKPIPRGNAFFLLSHTNR